MQTLMGDRGDHGFPQIPRPEVPHLHPTMDFRRGGLFSSRRFNLESLYQG
jgi:hypothetical protein